MSDEPECGCLKCRFVRAIRDHCREKGSTDGEISIVDGEEFMLAASDVVAMFIAGSPDESVDELIYEFNRALLLSIEEFRKNGTPVVGMPIQ